MNDLPLILAEAIRRYGRDVERSQIAHRADSRLEAVQSLASARRALDPRQKAIAELVAVRGRSIPDLAKASGEPVDKLEALFRAACQTLADHYESREAA